MSNNTRLERPTLDLDIAGRTDPGLVRQGNEDAFVTSSTGAFALLAVCDGMGGAAAGEVASATAAGVIRDGLAEADDAATPTAIARRLLTSVEDASRKVFRAAQDRPSCTGMGTTATACALAGDRLYVAQVGDSRAYLLRGGALTQLTRDQTLARLLVEQGQLAPEDEETFEHRNVILQAIGTHERVEVDLTHVTVGRGDVLLVCSDGLHGVVAARVIRDLLDAAPSAEAACEALVAAALAAGAPDNVTCIVGRVVDGPVPTGTVAYAKADLSETPPDAPVQPIAPTLAFDDDRDVDAESRERGVLARLAAMFRRRRATV